MNNIKEQAIEELKRRGTDPTQQGFEVNPSPKATAYRELKGRGLTDTQINEELKPQISKSPSFLQSLIKDIPEYGGALVGGLIGAPAGPGGAIIGAGLGGAAGKAFQQLGERAFGDPNVPQSAAGAAKEIVVAGAKQAAYEAGGRLVVGGISKILAPFKKTLKPDAIIAQQTLDKYMPKETSPVRLISKMTGKNAPSLMPAEASDSRVLDLFQNIAEGSLMGGGKIAKYKNIIRPEAINNMAEDLVSQFGQRAEPDLIGEAFTLAVAKGLKPSRLAATTLYNTVDDMTKDLFISKPVTKKVISTILDKAGNPIINNVTEIEKAGIVSLDKLKGFAKPLSKIAKDVEGIEAKNAGDDLIQAIMSLDKNVSYTVAKELRSRLISRIDEFSIINKKAPAIGKAKKAVGLIDEAIETALKEHNPEALELWRQANQLYRTGSEQFDNAFIRRLVKQGVDSGNPEVIAKQIFKPGAISNIKKAKNAVDEKTWAGLKSWYVQDILKKSATPEGELSGKAFLNQLTGKTGMGDKTLAEIFKPEELTALKNVATTLNLALTKQSEGIGKMWIQLAQGTAMVGFFNENTRPYSILIAGGPVVLARMLTNPIAVKWLTQGMKLPAKSPQGVAILTKLAGLATEVKIDMERKGEIPVEGREVELQKLKGQSTIGGFKQKTKGR